MQAEPFSGVTVPLDVEAIAADPVEAGERCVELFAEVFREAGAVASNEAILGAVPLSPDIDGVVELRRPDSGQETGLQEVVDQLLAAMANRTSMRLTASAAIGAFVNRARSRGSARST